MNRLRYQIAVDQIQAMPKEAGMEDERVAFWVKQRHREVMSEVAAFVQGMEIRSPELPTVEMESILVREFPRPRRGWS